MKIDPCDLCCCVAIELITEYTITLGKTLIFHIKYPNILAVLFLSVSLTSRQD